MEAQGGMRVLLADGHPLLRLGIRGELEDAGFAVCGEAGDAREAVEAALREHPDVCLLDVGLPGGGIKAARRISSRLSGTRILMLADRSSEDDLVAALHAGAAGYLLKDVDPERLPDVVAAIHTGEPVVPRSLVGRLLAELRLRR